MSKNRGVCVCMSPCGNYYICIYFYIYTYLDNWFAIVAGHRLRGLILPYKGKFFRFRNYFIHSNIELFSLETLKGHGINNANADLSVSLRSSLCKHTVPISITTPDSSCVLAGVIQVCLILISYDCIMPPAFHCILWHDLNKHWYFTVSQRLHDILSMINTRENDCICQITI